MAKLLKFLPRLGFDINTRLASHWADCAVCLGCYLLVCLSISLLTPTNLVFGGSTSQGSCTYSTYRWNTQQRRAVDFVTVKKDRSTLNKDEIDKATGCSVCEEDQATVEIPGIPIFQVCKKLSVKVSDALRRAKEAGFEINEIVGWRVGRTRGPIDQAGNRTEFSNHSYGTAIDINTSNNGLYDNCFEMGPTCKLIKGGTWDPANLLSITDNSAIVLEMNKVGFRWGGRIDGKQKDFMHFSLTGY